MPFQRHIEPNVALELQRPESKRPSVRVLVAGVEMTGVVDVDIGEYRVVLTLLRDEVWMRQNLFGLYPCSWSVPLTRTPSGLHSIDTYGQPSAKG